MNQQPDKLFRDKLQSFQTPAPSGAWSRIEANLDKKNDKVLWFRIAASLLLIAIATYLLWPTSPATVSQPQLAAKKETEQRVTPQQQKEEQITRSAPAKENAIAEKPKPTKSHAVRKQSPAVKGQEASVVTQEKVAIEDHALASHDEVVEEIVPVVTETETPLIASAETQKVKIIFSAEDIDNKYLDKKALAEATSDDKKSSTLKKLLDTAYDLKYNQDPFGELRQKKNEILALNFKTDKQRK
ncbi:MAG TPA: hypothetical protein VGD40_24330 [Chryseosolibacter sp.]